MTHLVIAGHGKQKNGTFDPGATGFITKGEHKYVVEDLFPAMKKYLPKGHKVVLFSDHKVSNYGDLVQLVKKYKATQVTEIHFDAATASARGGHVIIYNGYSPDKVDLALRDVIEKMVGVRYTHKGHKGISGRDNLYNVNVAAQNNITYRLIELGFGTNKTDSGILVNKVDEYAKSLVEVIAGKAATPSKPKEEKPKPTPSKPKPKPSGYTGNSIVDYLKSIKENSSFGNRKKLAEQHGIKNYRGTAAQNKTLLAKLRSGTKPVTPSKPKPKPSGYTGNSVVDYLKSIKADSSFGNRKKLAAKHGIKNYRGTAAQNTQLLKKLRG